MNSNNSIALLPMVMGSCSASFCVVFLFISTTFCATVIDDLVNLQPPSDFKTTISSNCLKDPSLRYCNSSDLDEIFRFTIVAAHLCNESNNPNCVQTFPAINLKGRPHVAPLYLSFTFFWKYCPITILSIHLSNNSLRGTFPNDVFFCTQIQDLDLSHNLLSGDVPVQAFSSLTNLTRLNLSYNQFSESDISDSEFFQRFNASSFIHSGVLPTNNQMQNYGIKVVILLVGFPTSVILMVACLCWLCFRRPDYLPRMLRNNHIFTPSMLNAATNGFSNKNTVGKVSENRAVYRGILRDGFQVRIEMNVGSISREKLKKFVDECKVLVQLSHKNLVQVYGWCSNRNLRAVVTEWTGQDTVETWLSESAPPLKQRFKVMDGIVKAMRYLQEQWPEVDYDLRISSVLIHGNLQPLIARFKVGENSRTKNGRVMREEFEGVGEVGFVEYVTMHHPENLHKLIDRRIEVTENTLDQAKQAVGIGLLCTHHSTSRQLSLDKILNMITTVYASKHA